MEIGPYRVLKRDEHTWLLIGEVHNRSADQATNVRVTAVAYGWEEEGLDVGSAYPE